MDTCFQVSGMYLEEEWLGPVQTSVFSFLRNCPFAKEATHYFIFKMNFLSAFFFAFKLLFFYSFKVNKLIISNLTCFPK